MTSKYIFNSNTKIELEYSDFQNSQYNSVDGLKGLLCNFGPVMVSMWADNPEFKNRQVSNYILPCESFFNNPDHAVLLVGYQQNNQGNFWILQNSWDSNWGNHGLFAISMECRNISKYFKTYCFVKSITGDINYNDNYLEDTFDFKKLKPWKRQLQEFYDESLKTGFISPSIEDSKLDSFYANISQDTILKTSTNNVCDSPKYKYNLDWSNPEMNPYSKVIICETDDQGYCGSCWLFALTNMVQSSISLNRLRFENKTYNVPISKQYLANNMKNMGNPLINKRFVCNGGNMYIFEHLSFGGTFYLNGKYQSESGVGGIANELCKYMCQEGNKSCVQQKCSKEVPKYKQKSKEIDDNKQINLKNIWEKYGVYIVILIVIIIIIIVSL